LSGVTVILAQETLFGVKYTIQEPFCLRDTIMWRQGDVLIISASPIDAIPAGATKRPNCVLAEGELTGHSHRIDQPGVAELFESRGTLYLRVLAKEAKVVHQEHGPITLAQGLYVVWQQREYTPESVRRVRD